MWEEWIQDEQQISEDHNEIIELFEEALKDYYYYKICRKYCKFVLDQYYKRKIDVNQVRQVHENVLQIYGLDVNRSFKFWEPYLKLEKEIFDEMQTRSGNNEEISKQESKIRSIYKRRVIFPTTDMVMTWNEYKEWEQNKEEFAKMQERYKEACSKMDSIVSFEEKFQNAYQELEENNLIDQMIDLLKNDLTEIAGENFNYVMLYFERILAEYTLNNNLWEIYVNYTDELCKKKELRQRIYEKAIKNCPQELEFWLSYMRESEKNEVDFDTIQQTAIQAIEQGGEQVGIDFHFEILKYLCEFQVRQFIVLPGVKPDLNNEGVQKQVDQIRSLYTDAMENIQSLNPDDPNLLSYLERLLLNWVEVEAYKIQDKKKVQEIMEDYVKSNGKRSDSWQNYIKLMRTFSDNEKTLRGLFKRGLQTVKDNKLTLGILWLEWEKKFGTIQTLDQCIKHMKKLELYGVNVNVQQQQQSSQNVKSEKKKDNKKEKPQKDKKQEKPQKKHQRDTKLEELEEETKENRHQNKRQKRDQENGDHAKNTKMEITSPVKSETSIEYKHINKRTLFFRNLSDTTEEEDIQNMFQKILPDVKLLDVRIIREEDGTKRGIAFVDVENQEMAEKSLKLKNHHLKGKSINVDLSLPPSEKEKNESTVFVNNLPFTCTEEMLRSHFADVGEINEVRLIRTHQGQVKGFAYIEFKNKKSVWKAIETKHKTKLGGRSISVQKSESNKKEATIGYTVHVNNLSFKVGEEEIRNYFEKNFGEVKLVHLVKDTNGNSKGFAFVEFVDEDSMNRAIKEKQVQLLDRMAIIKKSTRQVTAPQQHQHETQNFQKKRDAKKERKRIISDIITEVNQNDNTPAVDDNNQTQVQQANDNKEQAAANMSNFDFKKMILGGKK